MNSYDDIIQRNPIVPFSMNGYQKSAWYNYNQMSNSSVKKYVIVIYANTPGEAIAYANQMKTYLENNPMTNRGGALDDVSVGMRQPVRDLPSMGYKVDLVMDAGMLRIPSGSRQPKTELERLEEQYVMVVHDGEYVKDGDAYVTDGEK